MTGIWIPPKKKLLDRHAGTVQSTDLRYAIAHRDLEIPGSLVSRAPRNDVSAIHAKAAPGLAARATRGSNPSSIVLICSAGYFALIPAPRQAAGRKAAMTRPARLTPPATEYAPAPPGHGRPACRDKPAARPPARGLRSP